MINDTNTNVKKLLVLGGTGFIGRHLVEKILKAHMNHIFTSHIPYMYPVSTLYVFLYESSMYIYIYIHPFYTWWIIQK